MVNTYGIAAYLGVPIGVNGQILGSLCVADGQPRHWGEGLVDEMSEIAARVSRRLEQMTKRSVAPRTNGAPPEKLAGDVSALAAIVQRSLVEVGPMVRLAKGMSQISPDALARAASVLTEASNFYEDVMTAVAELCVATEELERKMAARTAS
jgi:GAF domain-containing protein